MAKKAVRFDVHPGVKMVQEWTASLRERTGRSLEDWISVTVKEGPGDEPGRRAWLKEKHALGTNTASWLAERAMGKPNDEESPAAYLAAAGRYMEEQYSGKKSALRPIFDALYGRARALGKDVRVCPCKTMVPLYRNHVFGQIKATTNTRIDLGLALAKHTGKLPARLIDTGGAAKKDRITHRIAIQTPEEIDDTALKWLARAYALDA
jgi:hypothetical protein